MTDNEKIEEAVKLVNEGMRVMFGVRGLSMLPFIVGGRDSVVLEKPSALRVGDIVLAWCSPGRYVVHRIFSIDGDSVTLMGDGNIVGKEHCRKSDVKAKATHVAITDGGKPRPLYTRSMRMAAKAWRIAMPIRRYILYIIRLTLPKKYKN